MKYDTLCFSGGGISGMLFLGALYELEKYKIINMNEIKNYYGTSIGSILSFIFSLGYTIKEIIEFVKEFDFKKLEPEIDCDILFNDYGINSGTRIISLLQTLLEAKLNVSNITFKQLYELTNNKIGIVTTNFTKNKEVLFSYDTTPEFSVLLAIRMSIAIPLVFTPVKYENELYVDGCITNNFPIKYCNKDTTLGLYLVSNKDNDVEHFVDFFLGIFSIINKTITTKFINEHNEYDVIKLFSQKGISGTNFSFTIEYKTKLVNLGKDCVKEKYKDMPQIFIRDLFNELLFSIFNSETHVS
jgi:predicted acylesterase/phospholipase RssA